MTEEENQSRTQHTRGAIINEYQAQSLTVVLRMLERILLSLDALSSDSNPVTEGIMVSLVNPLSPVQKAYLTMMSGRARTLIGMLAVRFELKHETANLAREIQGRLVEMWATLEDARSHKLRRYGEVDPRLSAALDPAIEELISIVLTMDRELMATGSATLSGHTTQGNTATGAQGKEEAQD